jgi:protein-L-isoaspartate(D-aspartate) O-methyltransferase
MILPVGNQYTQDLVKIVKDDRGWHQVSMGGCRFVKLIGEEGWNGP